MPTPAELEYFLDAARGDGPSGALAGPPPGAPAVRRPDRDAVLARLHRVTPAKKARKELLCFAFDHRNQFFELAQQAGADESRIELIKSLFVEAVAQTEAQRGLQGRVGVIIDDRYGQDALNAATGRGWWIGRPVELSGSMPLIFEHGRSIGTTLVGWPSEHVAKCLVRYHPDHPHAIRLEQEAQIRALYEAVQVSGHELLLELIVPKDGPAAAGDTVFRSMKRLYNLGIYPEWWKLEPMSAGEWHAIDALMLERDPNCRGVVLLGLSSSLDGLRDGFEAASASASCRGFAVGRTIFLEPSRAWFASAIGDDELIASSPADRSRR